jgi:hypothetical protein
MVNEVRTKSSVLVEITCTYLLNEALYLHVSHWGLQMHMKKASAIVWDTVHNEIRPCGSFTACLLECSCVQFEVKVKWLQRPVAWPSLLQEENEMWGHNMVASKFVTWSNKDINQVVPHPFTLDFWCDVGHVTKKLDYFVGLSVYCWWLCLCVRVGRRAAAFSGVELLLPSLSSEPAVP